MIAFLFRLLSFVAVRTFFRRIEVNGLEHVPTEGPVILVPNHTNALVDPLIVQYPLRRRAVPTAKASLQSNPLLRLLFRGLGAIVFERPGEQASHRESANKNAQSIKRCRALLISGHALCLFPEGKSHSEPQMLPFKQGLARIAADLPVPLTIVPVGIYYTAKSRFRSNVRVCYGEPIDAASLPEQRQAFIDEVELRVRSLNLNFDNAQDATVLRHAASVLEAESSLTTEHTANTISGHIQLVQRMQTERANLPDQVEPKLEQLEKQVASHNEQLERVGVTPSEVYMPMNIGRASYFLVRELELFIVGGLIALWAAINHLAPYLVVRGIALRLTREDDQFASNAIYPGMIVFPAFYAIQLAIAWLALPSWLAVLYTVALPLSGLYYLGWRDRVTYSWRRSQAFIRWLRSPALQAELQAQSNNICMGIRNLTKGYGHAGTTTE